MVCNLQAVRITMLSMLIKEAETLSESVSRKPGEEAGRHQNIWPSSLIVRDKLGMVDEQCSLSIN